MAPTTSTKKEKLFAKYLEESKIFVVDAQAVSRTRLIRLLKELGAKTENISSIADYNEALEKMETERPRIILSDFKIQNGSGFDLLHNYRKINPDNKDHLFILVTSDSSQSLVAQAAEEDVDSFILKPYTVDVLKSTLISTAINKLYPSPYIQKIEEGKELLFNGKPQESIPIFKEAKKMNKKPTLACFYIGQAEFMKESMNGAEDSYREGLDHNKIHYKCLVSLFDLFYELQKYDEAYDVVKTIAQFFPANPERLATVLRLAIQTNNFSDIEDYYEIFVTLDERTSDILTYICAALAVCGRFYFQKNEEQKAIRIFTKLGRTTAGNPKFLRIGIENFIEFGHLDIANDFLTRFDRKSQTTDDFAVAKYLATQHELSPNESINIATGFISKDIHIFGVYLVLIRRALEAQRRDQAEKYLEDATKLWPDKIALKDILSRNFNQKLRPSA